MAHQTDSITIHDVIKFLQGFDINDRFLTVVEKEDGFSYICRLILPLIFRHASQSKPPPHGNSLPRIRRIQKIAALEGIFPELSSSPKYATTPKGPLEQSTTPDRIESPEHHTTLENSLSSEQSLTPDRNESPEHNTTLEDSQTLEKSATPDRNESPEHSTTLGNSLSSEQSLTPDRNKSPEHNTTLEDAQSSEQSLTPDRNESPEHSMTLEDSLSSEQSATLDRNKTQESASPQQYTSIAANTLCAESSSPPADGSTPTLMLETVPFQDSAIELSDSESEKNSLSSSSPQATEHEQITSGDPKTTTNPIPIAENQDDDETLDYTTLASTINTSLRFPLWSDSPESFWGNSKETLDPKDYSLITNPKVFVKGALDKKSQLDDKILQDRFYSILICKLYEKVIATPRVTPALVQQFLDIL